MKKLSFIMTTPAEDRELAQHRANKRKAARQLRKLKRDSKAAATTNSIQEIVKAARLVVRRWSKGDLAAAVRRLDGALKFYNEVTK